MRIGRPSAARPAAKVREKRNRQTAKGHGRILRLQTPVAHVSFAQTPDVATDAKSGPGPPPTTKRPHVANVGRRGANLALGTYPLNAKLPRSVFLNRDSFPFTDISLMMAL